MAFKVSDFIIQRLQQWGVSRLYGYAGDGINGVIGAIQRNQKSNADNKINFVQVRHEEMAAFMACAHAKLTGEVGVCFASSGPGGIHLLNGLYDAKMDRVPVVALVGQQVRPAMGSAYQQEVDMMSLFKDVASDFVQTAMVPSQVRHLIDRAVRIALAKRTVTCVILPHDVQDLEMEMPSQQHGATLSGVGFSNPRVVPNASDLQKAADVLNAGQRVAILMGAGAQGATAEVIQLADKLGAGIAKALLGFSSIPDTEPYVTGSIGLLGTQPSYDMMRHCDTFLMIGSSFPYSEFLPPEGKARGIQIDIDPSLLSLRYPMEVNLTGDSRETLQAILPLVQRKADRTWQESIEKDVLRWQDVIKERAMIDANPVNPQRVFWELNRRLPLGCILACDTGTATVWYSQYIKFRADMLGTLSGSLATMGAGVPYAIAAKFAYPNRPVIALVGDGAMEMNGNAELLTIAKYWQEWDDPRLIILVLNNRELSFVSWEMRIQEGDPKFSATQDIPDFPYAQYAQSIGLRGVSIEHPDQIESVLDEALSSRCPIVIEARVDADVPPLPPHITFEQAKGMAESLMHGDPNTRGILRLSFLEMFKSALAGPHSS